MATFIDPEHRCVDLLVNESPVMEQRKGSVVHVYMSLGLGLQSATGLFGKVMHTFL